MLQEGHTNLLMTSLNGCRILTFYGQWCLKLCMVWRTRTSCSYSPHHAKLQTPFTHGCTRKFTINIYIYSSCSTVIQLCHYKEVCVMVVYSKILFIQRRWWVLIGRCRGNVCERRKRADLLINLFHGVVILI